MIEVQGLCKEYKILKNNESVLKLLGSMLRGQYNIKKAVQDISFTIQPGELVGYVGPNGAGKSTTIKMLCGVLVPTSGMVRVNGVEPSRNRKQNAMHIGVVFGQRSQLYWDLPVRDSFILQQKLYDIPDAILQENIRLFVDILDMEKFLDQPVRQLSLGQRMRANIALSMLHNPEIVYLDEPTIGLDILAKSNIRDFIIEVNRLRNTTFILTTHDMDDIDKICKRLIFINEGRLQYDGEIEAFRQRYGNRYVIQVELENEGQISHPKFEVIRQEKSQVAFSYDIREIGTAEVVAYLYANYSIRDIHIEEASTESILRELYKGEAAAGKA